MDAQTAIIAVNLIDLILTKGIPAYMEWQDGVKLDNPTLADFEALKVKTMDEKEIL
jgi:hypothetical protein